MAATDEIRDAIEGIRDDLKAYAALSRIPWFSNRFIASRIYKVLKFALTETNVLNDSDFEDHKQVIINVFVDVLEGDFDTDRAIELLIRALTGEDDAPAISGKDSLSEPVLRVETR